MKSIQVLQDELAAAETEVAALRSDLAVLRGCFSRSLAEALARAAADGKAALLKAEQTVAQLRVDERSARAMVITLARGIYRASGSGAPHDGFVRKLAALLEGGDLPAEGLTDEEHALVAALLAARRRGSGVDLAPAGTRAA